MGPKRRPFAMTLAALVSLGITSCMQPSTLPPPASTMRAPAQPSPNTQQLSRVTVPTDPASYGGLPTLSIDPWRPKAKTRDWTSIVIHHTATNRGNVESIHEAHQKRKDSKGNPWLGIGYHFVIGNGNGMGDGEIEPTFRWREQMHGAHAGDAEYNQHGIGIVLVGNFEVAPPSEKQLAAVKKLVGALKGEYGIASDAVHGHRDLKATACPGRYFPMEEVCQSPPSTLFGLREQDPYNANFANLEEDRPR